MIQTDFQSLTLKEIVMKNFQTAAVFEKYSLDFCCRGDKSIDQACGEKGIDSALVFNDLSQTTALRTENNTRFNEWDTTVLIDYIVQHHHAYVRKMVPVLYAHTQKVAAVHGMNHPEVVQIAKHFESVAVELQQHMVKEEQLLFPFITTLWNAKKLNTNPPAPPFGTVKNPIRMMEAEHQSAGDAMYSIRELSNTFLPPEDACTTYKITYQELQDFERDLHQHVHLENNILFPRAVQLEQEFFTNN